MPCYSHASHIGSDADSNSKSSDSSLNSISSSDRSGNSQQRRVAVCISQCSEGLEVWSLLWPQVRASSTSNQLLSHVAEHILALLSTSPSSSRQRSFRHSSVVMHPVAIRHTAC